MGMERKATPNGTCIETHKLVLAYGDGNNNKFWTVKLFDSDDVQCIWGRVGVDGDHGVHRGMGRSGMQTMMSDKMRPQSKYDGQAYREVDVIDGDFAKQAAAASGRAAKGLGSESLKQLAKSQIEHSSPETAKLIEYLADVNRHVIAGITGGKVTWNAATGLFQTPLGIVTPNSILNARRLLNEIGDFVADQDWTSSAAKRAIDDYFMLIPHDLGRKWDYRSAFSSLSAVQTENGVLDSLDASYRSVTTSTKKDTKKKDDVVATAPKVFETKLVLVESGKVIDMVKQLYTASINRMHHAVSGFKLKKVWEVEVAEMARAYQSEAQRINHVMRLWHGTQPSNCLSILKGGLVIPPSSSSHVTGRMFGDGLYFSDQSTKSLNYATSYWGGQDMGRYFMFLADVAMGKTYVPSGPSSRFPYPGHDSTFAKAGKSGVQNNEMIVYRTNQASLVYLIEFGR